MRLFKIILFATFLISIIQSCSDNDKQDTDMIFEINDESYPLPPEIAANRYYEQVKSKDFKSIIENLDEGALNSNTKQDWEDAFKIREANYGDLISYEKYKPTTVKMRETHKAYTLYYKCKYTNAIKYELTSFVKRGDKYLLSYSGLFDSKKELNDFQYGN